MKNKHLSWPLGLQNLRVFSVFFPSDLYLMVICMPCLCTENREIFAALIVGEFAFFQLAAGRQNSVFAAEI
jgi:hypothetical protein